MRPHNARITPSWSPPRSLAFSSLSYLTVVVLLLLLRALLPHGPTIPPIIVFDPPPDHRTASYDPIPIVPAGPPVVPPTAVANGIVMPVDDPAKDDVGKLFTPTEPPPIAGPADGSGIGKLPAGFGAGGPGGAPEVQPGVFEYVDVMPTLVTRVTPIYPPIAQQAGMSGEVDLWLRVGPDGHVIKVAVMHSNPLFDEAATKAALQWVFTPATTDGRPVAVWVGQRVVFVLHE